MTQEQKPIVVGRLGAVHGVKGWLKVNSFTDIAEGIFDYSPWLVNRQGKWVEVEVKNWRAQANSFVAEIKGLNDRNEAQTWVNCEIGIMPEQLQDLPEDEFYWKDLIGCEVINLKGYHMGKVSEILETGSNDVLRVKANAKDGFGKKERLIPFVTEQFVSKVDIAQQQIHVDWDPDF
ncbi:ribosome maturation factor RimM [Paraferrimonas sp. SM1919]|uniref:ribosome maturation factor RimM n=1 Tax=Paraferrimonas sp. SM1919 TaxID=2662263 RepID=UPI0013D4C65F|nr:ribosome maturation factor RimM [Paraferrimonas sp. SM1919]